MTKFEIACEKCFNFIADLGTRQDEYLEYCFENNIKVKDVENYVNKNYKNF